MREVVGRWQDVPPVKEEKLSYQHPLILTLSRVSLGNFIRSLSCARCRGMIGRYEGYHRKAVIDRMVRKALMEEREKVIKQRVSAVADKSDSNFDLSEVSTSPAKRKHEKFSESEDVDNMVIQALAASGAAGGRSEPQQLGSPTPGAEESFVSSSSSDTEHLLAVAENAAYEDSFASGFGIEQSADLNDLISSMAEEHVENLTKGEQAVNSAVEAIANTGLEMFENKFFETFVIEELADDESVKEIVVKDEAAKYAASSRLHGHC